VVLHDLAVPGSRANLDHLAIGPGGVFVIDSKHYRGRLQLDPSGRLWHGRYPLTSTLRTVDFEADQARVRFHAAAWPLQRVAQVRLGVALAWCVGR
jgi:hypothetical protein